MNEAIESIGEDIWIVDGGNVDFLGLTFPTRMTIVRVGDELWIHSPVAVANATLQQIDDLGEVRHVVSPNRFHHLFMAQWQQAYPAAAFYASPGLRKKRPDLRFDFELAAQDSFDWSGAIEHEVFGPNVAYDEVIFFHRASRTLVLTDLIVNVRTDDFGWWPQLFTRFDGIGYPNGITPRLYRATMKSRAQARVVYEKILDWDPARVVISHGEWFRDAGRQEMEKRLRWVWS